LAGGGTRPDIQIRLPERKYLPKTDVFGNIMSATHR
jgi:hypothetical protein